MTLIRILNGSKQVTNLPDGLAVWCDRRSALGNPFELRGEESRDDVCDAYAEYFDDVVCRGIEPKISADWWAGERGLKLSKAWKAPTYEVFMAELERLESVARDVRWSFQKQSLGLGCWCHPKRCHCDTIAAYLVGKLGVNDENVVTQGSLF
jgi:hypothetical protein